MIIKIETKYNVGDTVYFLNENKIMSGKITMIKLGYTLLIDKPSHKITYTIDKGNNPSFRMPIERNEDLLFPSREELINSL